MAKTKKSRSNNSYHGHDNNFLLLVAGGFIVVVIMIYYMGGQVFQKKSYSTTPSYASENTDAVESDQVSIKGFKYFPGTVKVKKGESVTWTNKDADVNSATADDGSFDTGALYQDGEGSVIFDTPGIYSYHSAQNPEVKGVVIVE